MGQRFWQGSSLMRSVPTEKGKTMREKLIELLDNFNRDLSPYAGNSKLFIVDDNCELADHLIANGVTVQNWIPVTERFPEDVYGKDREKILVLVRTKSGNVSQCARCADYDCTADATLSQFKWHKNGKFYWSKGKKVTHWMPLPQPPKGE